MPAIKFWSRLGAHCDASARTAAKVIASAMLQLDCRARHGEYIAGIDSDGSCRLPPHVQLVRCRAWLGRFDRRCQQTQEGCLTQLFSCRERS
jgi:hypothetical protein